MFKSIYRYLDKLNQIQKTLNVQLEQQSIQTKLMAELVSLQRAKYANNRFARVYSKKGFSQSDEDGLLSEIIHRLNIRNDGLFIELGVGNGLENNTLALLLGGWSGVWISGQEVAFETSNIPNLYFAKEWITKENLALLIRNSLASLQRNPSEVNLLSLDLDGNDYYILAEFLQIENLSPDIIICEYNAAFGPYLDWKQDYEPDHRWQSDQYFGASFSSLVTLCGHHGYRPVCCNPRTGANIFFVKQNAIEYFPEIPEDLANIFEDGFYQVNNKFLHRINARIVDKTFKLQR
jgi:hypothetical protein